MTKKRLALPHELTPEWIGKNHRVFSRTVCENSTQLDCTSLSSFNSLAAAFIAELHKRSENSGNTLTLVGFHSQFKSQLDKTVGISPGDDESSISKNGLFEKTGEAAYSLYDNLKEVVFLLSESIYWSTLGLLKRKTILSGATSAQMVSLGSSSLPIVLLLSFLIGLTLAIQSAIQLSKFGASIYIASGIGISMVTEIGPMMTAVILAGRSGSSITAEISTMVVQEELRALKTMAINPIHYILLPRFWALSVTLPLLVICADLIGIFAGFLIALLFADVPALLFLNELQAAVTFTMVWQSMLKTLVFAWIITLVAVYKGMNAKGGADAVGKATTSCVVTCLFSIILADAIFSFVFYF